MRRIKAAVVVGTVLLFGGQLFAQPAIVGQWNIVMGDPSKGALCWLGVEQTEEGQLVAHYNPRVAGLQKLKKLEWNAPQVEFQCPNKWGNDWVETTMTGTVKGDQIEGLALSEKGTIKWKARRAIFPVDATGEWVIPAIKGTPHKDMVLNLRQKGNAITGMLVNKQTKAAITDGRLVDGTAVFRAMLKIPGHRPRNFLFQAKVMGDILKGQFTGGDEKYDFTAKRKREWGQPIELFNGKSLAGWQRKPSRKNLPMNWKVIDGILINTARGSDILYDASFRDFKLRAVFRVSEHGNSGIYLRNRYEVQIVDCFGKEKSHDLMGGIYSRIIPKMNAAKPAGQWQILEITLIGNYVTVMLNGRMVIDNEFIEGMTGGALNNNDVLPGGIFVQGDHSKVEFSELVLVPATEPDGWPE